jgi:hypothetical protein
LSKAFKEANEKATIAEPQPINNNNNQLYYKLPKELRQLLSIMINIFYKFLQLFERKTQQRVSKSEFGRKI